MKILIASGGSGGHIFPAVALADELAKNNTDIIFVASRRKLDKDLLEDAPYKKIYLSANPMPYKFNHRTFIFFIKLIIDALLSLYILIRQKPRVVVGFGGYTAGVILLLASLFGIKTVAHEQNLMPGRTNRLLDRNVDEVAISFHETRKYFKNKNVVFTGNPLRKESLKNRPEESFKNLGLERDRFTVLVMGGSQGAKSLNELVVKSVIRLPDEKKKHIQLIHITGKKNKDRIQSLYDENGIRGRAFDFVKRINEAYSVCDMAISRSGAAAIFELAAFKKPMVLIPYPNEKNNQRFNAQFFAERKAAICLNEKNACGDELKNLISDLVDNSEKRSLLSENAARLSIIDGAKKLGEEVMKWREST